MCLSIAAATSDFAVMCSDSYSYTPSTDRKGYSSQRMLKIKNTAWSFVGNEEFMTNDFWKLLVGVREKGSSISLSPTTDVVADNIKKYLSYRISEIKDIHSNCNIDELEKEGFFNFCLLGVSQISKFPYIVEISSFKGFNPCYYACVGDIGKTVSLLVVVPGEFYAGNEQKRDAFINLRQQIEMYYTKHKEPNVDSYGLLIDAICRNMYYFSYLQETLWGEKDSGGVITSIVLKRPKLQDGLSGEGFVLSCPSQYKDFSDFKFIDYRGDF